MKVSDIMALLEITGWRAVLFWVVNIPRHFLEMDLVIYRCMIGRPVVDGHKKITIEVIKK